MNTRIQKLDKKQHWAFDGLYKFYNKRFFENRLSSCEFGLKTGGHQMGSYYPSYRRGIFFNKMSPATITLNPNYFYRGLKEVCAVFLHEQVHHWEFTAKGENPGRGNYHNQRFADKMAEVGIICSQTGRPGGAATGTGMSQYIEAGGVFEKSMQEMPSQLKTAWEAIVTPYLKTQTYPIVQSPNHFSEIINYPQPRLRTIVRQVRTITVVQEIIKEEW
ncbi:MAG: SprT-like domain-containing protein [Saprospiraceae bacterium]